MFEIRLHGRGGQGVVTAAELLSIAAFHDGKQAQAFPSFGSERMGAPVTSFCRIAETSIRVREPVAEPDALIVIDATLLHHVDLFAGLAPDGYMLLNSVHSPSRLGIDEIVGALPAGHVVTLPATDLAREHLGRPLPTLALLGAFAALTGTISADSLDRAVRQRFRGAVADGNVTMAHAGFAAVKEPSHA